MVKNPCRKFSQVITDFSAFFLRWYDAYCLKAMAFWESVEGFQFFSSSFTVP